MEEIKIDTQNIEEENDRSKVIAFVPKIPIGFKKGSSLPLPFNENFNYKNILLVGNIKGIFGDITYYSKKENGKPDWEYDCGGIKYNEVGRANLYWLRMCLENGAHVTVIERLEDHWFLTENPSYFDNIKECVVECMVNNKIRYSQFSHVKAITGPDSKFNLEDYVNTNMKFDVCIMNAPYDKGLHEKFEAAGIDLVTDEIVWIGPLTWLLSKSQNKELCSRCNQYYTNIQIIESDDYFDANIGANMGIIYINKKKNKYIEYNGICFDKCSEIKHFSHDILLNSIYKKIQPYNFTDSVHMHVRRTVAETTAAIKNTAYLLIPNDNDYIIRIPLFAGSSNTKSRETGEFWGMLSKYKNYSDECGLYNTLKSKKDKNKNDFIRFYIKLDNEYQLQNFWKFIHTDFSMLCLYFIKKNLHIDGGELKYLPWLDWNQEWDDLKLFKKFNLNKKEVEHIYKVIPNYFSNNREEVLKNY